MSASSSTNTQSKSKKEMALELGVSRNTFRKWMKRAGLFPEKPVSDKLYTPAEVDKIRKAFGV